MADPPEAAPGQNDSVHRSLEFLSQEIARLEQLVAAMVVLLWDDSPVPETLEVSDAIANWAMQHFDHDILRECLADYLEPVTTPGMPIRPREQQRQLFGSEEDAPAET